MRKRRIERTAQRMFGHSSIDDLVEEHQELSMKLKDSIDVDSHKVRRDALPEYSKWVTLDKLKKMYEEER